MSLQLLVENLLMVYELQLEMKTLVKQKRDVLINGQTDELSSIMQQESIWLLQTKHLEEERIKIFDKLAEENNVLPADITITGLINNSLTSTSEKVKLKEINDKLKSLLDEIKRENEINTQLIKQSLDFVSHSLNTITQESTQTMTYSRSSTTNPKNITNAGIFDKKA
ncbi:MAG: flagellar protein FlgN [Vulcanibacillus sp.]